MALLSGSGQPAPPRESAGAAVAPGLLTRVAQGLRWAVGGRAPTGSAPAETAAESGHDDWFGPSAPLAPVAQDQAVGRQFDYPVGYNLTIRPRQADPIGFDQLRGLADSYDLLRLVIETRKDQIARLDWCFRPRNGAPVVPGDPRIARLTEFFANPDREHGWDGWLRMLVEDMLVIDAATLYPRRDQGGALYALEPVDGATIKRVLDDRGRTPLPPDPAYQQVLKGLPAVDYTRDELLYLPRNPRSWRVYGFSPVEQVVMTVNIALRRQLHQLEYYTEGSVPEALIGVPETWTPDQIGQFQAYWDALLEGDTAQRRHARFVPATISKSFVQTKDAALKDEYDEWLARIICYAFAVAPGSLTRDNNRATADFQHSQALQEGLLPLMRWVKALVDRSIADHFGWPDLEFAWKQDRDIDPLTQAQINQIYLAAGVLTPGEVRAEIGKGDAAAKRQAGGVALGKASPVRLTTGGNGVSGHNGGGNPNHDELGRFASSPGGGAGAAAGTVATASGAASLDGAASVVEGAVAGVGATVAGALAGLAVLLIPKPAGDVRDGIFPNNPTLSYHWDEGELTLYRTNEAGEREQLFCGRADADGNFRDASGTIIAHSTPSGWVADLSVLENRRGKDKGKPGRDAKSGEEEAEEKKERKINKPKAESKFWNSDKLRSVNKTVKRDKKGNYYEWDHEKNEIEMYDRFGKHKGSLDPETGDMIKGPLPSRNLHNR